MIVPHSFDIETCKTIVGDSRMRLLETHARGLADNGSLPVDNTCKIFFKGSGTYWCEMQKIFEYMVWIEAYIKRCERLVRKEII